MIEHKPLVSQAVYDAVLVGYQAMMTMPENPESRLDCVVSEALANPGSLTRAQLAYQVMLTNGSTKGRALQLATAVEYDHTASLLLDDLPCMDDATERRNRICPHKLHGEAATILGALALINRAYALFWEVIAGLPDSPTRRATELLETCLGARGILNGQSKDLHFAAGPRDEGRIGEIASEKTASLLRLSLVLPAVVMEVDETDTARLEALSEYWGLAYQIIDDIKDVVGSSAETGKTTGQDLGTRPNLVHCVGFAEALSRANGFLEKSGNVMQELQRSSAHWSFLQRLQKKLAREATILGAKALAA